VQLPAIKTLSWLYSERIELEVGDAEALRSALWAVVKAMEHFPDNIILQQHGCYALCAMVEHSADPRTGLNEEAFTAVTMAVAEALRLVKGRCDSRRDSSSYNALYLRKEATRCIEVLCRVRPELVHWFRDQGLQEVLADALQTTASGVWDGRRDLEAEETLRLELLALSHVLGPPPILESLRRWGIQKPAVVRAAADAVADLARDSAQRPDSSTPKPVEALSAAGCAAELLAAMRVHASDEDLQGRLHLAVGFLGAGSTVPAP